MSMVNLLLCCLFSFVCLSWEQDNDGTPCYTSRDEYGLCISIRECKVFVNLLLTKSTDPKVVQYLRTSICGYIGTTPMVCCPESPQNIDPPIPEPKTEPSNNNLNTTSRDPRVIEYQLPSPPDCGFSNKTHIKIAGGVTATLGEFPWIVALGYRNPDDPNVPKWLCGGTLITDRHILTAGHCVHNRKDLYIARVGEHDFSTENDGASPEDIPLIKAKVHEDYSSVQFTNDIAILTLKWSPSNDTVYPICLPHEEPYRSKNFLNFNPFVAGWGAIYFNGPKSSSLQVAPVPVVNNDDCKRAFANKSVIDDRIICAGWTTGGKDACQGDSGGPLMYGKSEGKNIRYYEIGVVSYGFRCAEPGYPGVYSRVTNFIEWIKRNLD